MTSIGQDFTITAGAYRVLEFTVRDPNTGLVVDLTDYAVEWRAEQQVGTGAVQLTGAVQAPATNGIATVSIDESTFDNGDVGRWDYQLWLTDGAANPGHSATGICYVRPAIPHV